MLLFASILACSDGGSAPPDSPPADSAPSETTTSPTPAPVVEPPGFDAAAGYELTPDGAVNRVADVPSSPDDYAYGTSSCQWDWQDEPDCVPEACTDRPNGRCAQESCLNSWCRCVYACASDADCAAGEACLRPEHGLGLGIPLPQCVPAECRTGADCASGECGVARYPANPSNELRLVCRTPDDECRVDADCVDSSGGSECLGTGGFACGCQNCWCD